MKGGVYMLSKLASKDEIRQGLISYFCVNESDNKSYYIGLCEERMDDCFDVSDMDEINQDEIERIIDYIFRCHVKEI